MEPLSTLLIIFTAVYIIFLYEFTSIIKKITSIFLVRLLVPLIFFSCCEENNYAEIKNLLLWVRGWLLEYLQSISQFLPPPYAYPSTEILFLYTLGIIPLLLLYWRAHFTFGWQFRRRRFIKEHKIFPYAYLILWIIISILVVVK